MAQALDGITDAKPRLRTGQANTVLVLGQNDDTVAVVSLVTAVTVSGQRVPSIIPVGPSLFDPKVLRHWDDVVLLLLHRIAASLGLSLPAFEVSVSNLSAASAQDRSIVVQGYSADVAVFLACLSAWLNVPLRPGILATGHLASPDGIVRMVRHLSAKLSAARRHGGVYSFLYPALDGDDSLENLAADERTGIEEALLSARNDIRVQPVHDMGDLICLAFEESSLIVAALNNGYFAETLPLDADTSGMSALAAHLPERFWKCLEMTLQDGQNGSELLRARVRFQGRQSTYPEGFGTRLYQLLASVPRSIREVRVSFPLLDPEDTHILVLLSSPTHIDDLRHLLEAVEGGHSGPLSAASESSTKTTVSPLDIPDNVHLHVLLKEIDSENLARRIGDPIEEARGTFLLKSITAKSSEDLLDVASSFYLHLLRHTSEVPSVVRTDRLASEAFALLDRTFSREGGYKAAVAEALTGTRGRLKYVLDSVTKRYRAEQEEKHVTWVFKRTLTSLEYEQQVLLVESFLRLLGPALPEEVVDTPAARYLEDIEMLVRTYVQSIGQMKRTIRAL